MLHVHRTEKGDFVSRVEYVEKVIIVAIHISVMYYRNSGHELINLKGVYCAFTGHVYYDIYDSSLCFFGRDLL